MNHEQRTPQGLHTAIGELDARRASAVVATREDAVLLLAAVADAALALDEHPVVLGDAAVLSSVRAHSTSAGQIECIEIDAASLLPSEFVTLLLDVASRGPAGAARLFVLDAASALGTEPSPAKILEIQDAIDAAIPELGAAVLTVYDEATFDASVLTGAVICSPLVLTHDILCENQRYVPPREVTDDSEVLAVDRLLQAMHDAERNRRSAKERGEGYRALVESFPDAIFVHSGGAVVYANLAAAAMVGAASPREVLGHSVMSFVHPDSIPTVAGRVKMMMEQQVPAPLMVERFVRLDGTSFFAEVVATPSVFEGQPAIQVIMRDQTERHATEEELGFKSFLLDNVIDGICVRDPMDLCVLYVNEAMCALSGKSQEQFFSSHEVDWVIPEEREALRRYIDSVFSLGSGSTESFSDTSDGRRIPVEIHSSLITYHGRRALLSVIRDISERKEAEAAIEHMALHDPLTGLANRALLKDRIELAIAHARRTKGPLALIFLDLDHFKTVNDTAGHGIGDFLLQGVAERLRGVVRADDTVARLGGDEFTLVLPDIGSQEDARRIAEKILDELRKPIVAGDDNVQMTASLGVAMYGGEETTEELLRNADLAMYRAKECGRNSYRLYEPSMNTTARERFELKNDLRRAVEAGELEVVFQPIVRIADRAVLGAEALCRWTHPAYGPVPPVTFIPLAEESGIIVELGEWVLRTACAEARRWADAGHDLRIAVNLSPRQLDNPKFTQMVLAALSDTGLAPRLLEFEITETAAMRDAPRMRAVFRELRELGVRIAIDDFGVGYSSLDYLKKFPLDTLKVDRAFVKDVCDDPDSLAIASTIVALAHALRLDVVAEGVETEDQCNALAHTGCPTAQGYLFSHGVSAAEFRQLLEAGA